MRISDWSSDVCSSDLAWGISITNEYRMSESFAEMFEASLTGGQSMQSGTIVLARVLAVKADVVIVDAGLKSEGVIPLIEFAVDGEVTVAVGDEVEVALETVEDGFGETKFSKAKAERSEEHTSELQSLMRTPYAVLCLKKKKTEDIRC